VMYVIGYQNVTAYTTSMTMMFNYKHMNGSIYANYQNNPVVLDNSGAICFYDSNGYFNVLGGFKGGLAWNYPSTYGLYYPVLTDNSSVFFTDGQVVVGADIWSGAVTSISTYLLANSRGFAIAPGMNSTTVVGVTDDEVVFGNQVLKSWNSNPYFPGAGSAPANDGTGAGTDGGSSKAWIAAVVIGVLVVVVGIAVVLKKRSDAASFDEDYVPMNPTTQV